MAGRGRQWSTAGYLLTGVALVAALVLVAGALMQAQAESRRAAGRAAAYTPPPLSTPTPQAAPILAVIGDGDAVQAASSVARSAHWTSLVAKAEDLDVRTEALPGAGYATLASSGHTLLQEASRISKDAQLVVLVGGSADAGSDASVLQITRAAQRAITLATQRAPQAAVAVVGPVTSAGATHDELAGVSTALQNAAGSAGVPYVDPGAQVWLDEPHSSPTSLTSSDQREIAKHIEALTQQMLPSLSANGTTSG